MLNKNIFYNDIKVVGNGYITELLSENYDLEGLDYDIQKYGYFTDDAAEKKYNGYMNSDKFIKIYVIRGEHGNVGYTVTTNEPEPNGDTGVECIYLVRKNTQLSMDYLLNALDLIYLTYECYCNGNFSSLFADYTAYDNCILEQYNADNGTSFETVYELLDDDEHSDEGDEYVINGNASEAMYGECDGFNMDVLETAIRD